MRPVHRKHSLGLRDCLFGVDVVKRGVRVIDNAHADWPERLQLPEPPWYSNMPPDVASTSHQWQIGP